MTMGAVEAAPAGRGARERILKAAYELFSQRGISAVGIDTIIAHSGVAKMTLYRHFHSKEELVLAFLRRREALWTHQWLETEMLARAETPAERLLAIFDVFDRWFQQADFEGCAFINVLLESVPNSAVRAAAAHHLAHIRGLIGEQARAAGLAELERFSHTWHFLMKGCIVSANEGNREAAQQARAAAAIILQNWPRA
jgi:AcrR family transcriptional regulator